MHLTAQIRLRRPHIMPHACLLTCLTNLLPVGAETMGAESKGEGAKGPRQREKPSLGNENGRARTRR